MRHDTNIQHNGDCPDCSSYEKKIDRLYAKESELQNEVASALESYNRECKRNDELQEEIDRLKGTEVKLQSQCDMVWNYLTSRIKELKACNTVDRYGEIVNNDYADGKLKGFERLLKEIVDYNQSAALNGFDNDTN